MSKTKNILVTDFQDSGENVMIFTEYWTSEEVESKLKQQDVPYNEVYEVPTDDLGYYIYEPCHLDHPDYALSEYLKLKQMI